MERTQEGDARARDEFIERYMPLARSLALRYRRASEQWCREASNAPVGVAERATQHRYSSRGDAGMRYRADDGAGRGIRRATGSEISVRPGGPPRPAVHRRRSELAEDRVRAASRIQQARNLRRVDRLTIVAGLSHRRGGRRRHRRPARPA